MKRFALLLVSLVIIVSLIFGPSAFASGVPQEVLNASSSVVYIEVESAIGISSGSGFIVKNGSDGTYIATNNHVIELNLAGVSVWIGKDDKRSATVAAHSKELDLAILKLTKPIAVNALTLSDNAKQGDEVFAVGYPAAADYLASTAAHLSSEATITNGIISSIRTTKAVDYGPDIKLLQINADINSGNSGGPLLNAKGHVIGINSYGALDSQGIFGAISVGELIAFIDDNDLFQINTAGTLSADWPIYCLIGLLIAVILAFVFVPKLRNSIIRIFSPNKKEMELNEYLFRLDTPLDAYSIVSLIMPVLLGLRNKHMQGSVYLKLAPSAIAVTKNGFKLNESKDIASDEFYAPEIREGKFAGIRADIYGACALIRYILNYYYPSLVAGPGSAIAELTRIINKGLENRPEDRYGNMQDLISELSPLNRGIPDRILLSLTEMNRISKKEKHDNIIIKTEGKAKPKRKRPVLIIILAGCGLILAFVIFSAVNYFSAIDCANNYDFKEAYTYINNIALSEDIFPDNYYYIDAGYDMVNRNYDSAIQKLESYKNQNSETEGLIKEAKYRKAAMLADQCIFEESVALYSELGEYKNSAQLLNDTMFRQASYYISKEKFQDALNTLKELSKIGYPEADEKTCELYYVWACNLIQNSEFVEAYWKLRLAGDYHDSEQLLAQVKDRIYKDAIYDYRSGWFSKAKIGFQAIGNYLRSQDYLLLIGRHDFSNHVDSFRLWSLIGFEDASYLIMSYHASAIEFLKGSWKGGSKYLKIKGSSNYLYYNIPGSNYGNYYRIENGEVLLFKKKTPNTTKTLFYIRIINFNCIEVISFKNFKTYTLYRQ